MIKPDKLKAHYSSTVSSTDNIQFEFVVDQEPSGSLRKEGWGSASALVPHFWHIWKNLKDEGIPVPCSGQKSAGFNTVKEEQEQDVEGAGLNDTKPGLASLKLCYMKDFVVEKKKKSRLWNMVTRDESVFSFPPKREAAATNMLFFLEPWRTMSVSDRTEPADISIVTWYCLPEVGLNRLTLDPPPTIYSHYFLVNSLLYKRVENLLYTGHPR